MVEVDTAAVVVVFTVGAVEGSTVGAAECARVVETVLVAGLFLLLPLALGPGEALLLLVRVLVTALPDVQEIIFRGPVAAISQTGIST